MNKIEQEQHFNKLINICRNILLSKGDDYANTDRLSNFKIAGMVSGGNATTNCFNLICTKVTRISNLINKEGTPNNESVKDSILDLINYCILLDMIIEENENI